MFTSPCTRLLVISNECFAQKSSNGRTLMNFLSGWDPDALAQFYLRGTPDHTFCAHYYRVSDHDALASFKRLGKYKKSGLISEEPKPVDGQAPQTAAEPATAPEKKPFKNCRNMYLRHLVWKRFNWWNDHFDAFLDTFAPEAILFQAGDSPFMYLIARKIANKYEIPLIMYNSENYVLKKKIYSGASTKDLFHTLLIKTLRKEYAKLMEVVSHCIYSTEYLEQCYQEKYPHPGRSCALYTSTDMELLSSYESTEPFTVLYCGNLGVGRAPILSKFAKTLKEVDPSAVLKIYGKFTKDADRERMSQNDNVQYGGLIPYEEVKQEMTKASLLIHCENNDRLENLRAAFSTKIADCLACGKPFLVYATREYPFVQYLERNQCAHIASDSEELREVLTRCIEDAAYREQYIEKARAMALEHHNMQRNCEQVRAIVERLASQAQQSKATE